MDLQDDLDQMFRAPIEAFVAERDALSRRLRNAGHHAEARAVAALRRPSPAAWAVNQLALGPKDDALRELCTAAARVRAAHANPKLDGESLAELTRAHARARNDAQQAALAALSRAGRKATSQVSRAVQSLLAAVSATTDPPRPGRLMTDAEPPGFDALVDVPKTPHSSVATTRRDRPPGPDPANRTARRAGAGANSASTAADKQHGTKPSATANADTGALRELVDKAARDLADLEATHRRAASRLERARRDRDAAERRFEDARRELAEAEAGAHATAARLDEARATVAQARRKLDRSPRR